MKMFPNEEVIAQSNGITLTNRRIRNKQYDSELSFTSILLENIQSISMKYKSKPLLLIIGILLIAVSVLFTHGEMGILLTGAIMGCVFIAYYFHTRKHYLSISSAGEALNIIIKGQSTTLLLEYIDLVEETIYLHKKEFLRQENLSIS